MRRVMLMMIVAVLMIGAAAAAIGLRTGSGNTVQEVAITVTRDFGAETIGEPQTGLAPRADDTVMRLLKQHFDVTTRYGGGFVQEIDGLAGGRENVQRVDWFFYVNGVESSTGAAERRVEPGDRVWWDRHPWQAAMRIPAVVGSFPEPFLAGAEGRRIPVKLVCAGAAARTCDEVETRIAEAGATGLARSTIAQGPGEGIVRVIIGRWTEVRDDPVARTLERGPGASGVFARFDAAGRELQLLDAQGDVARTLAGGAGLVAATSQEGQRPTWLITGTDDVGVAAAAAALQEDRLQNTFALAIEAGKGVPLPVSDQVRQP